MAPARKQMSLPMPLPPRQPGPPRLKVPRTRGVRLEHDRPACPKCGPGYGAPVEEHHEPGRWYGPANSNLFCGACGTAWVGSPGEVAQAQRAERAWRRIEDAGGGTRG